MDERQPAVRSTARTCLETEEIALSWARSAGEATTCSAAFWTGPPGLGRSATSRKVIEMAYVITEPCVGVKDKACDEICPVDCIYENTKGSEFPDMLFIHPDECIDCGVCQPECPVNAIYPEDDVPDDQRQYIEINRTYFA